MAGNIASSTEANISNANTVRQTIVETIEAPRLVDIDTASFVTYREKREIYKRRLEEKNSDASIKVPLTTHRDSISKELLELFIIAGWVPADKVENITEDHLEICTRERAHIDPADYDLAHIERELRDVKLEKATKQASLQKQVWRLCLKYRTTLAKCGYDQLISNHPKLAVYHIMKRLTHYNLRSRLLQSLKLRKKELEKDFTKFMREVASEAKYIDRHDFAAKYNPDDYDSDTDTPGGGGFKGKYGQGRRNHRQNKKKYHVEDRKVEGHRDKTKDEQQSKGRRKRDRELPDCLNPKCDKKHFINDCEKSTENEKKRFKKEYYENKRRKQAESQEKPGNHKSDGHAGRIGRDEFENNTSIFSATFGDGAVEAVVMADQGSDVNVLSPDLFKSLSKAIPELPVTRLEKKLSFDNVRTSVPPLQCSRMIKADVQLRIRHGDKLMLRGMKWLVSDDEIAFAYTGRHVLSALGMDNRVLLSAARDRFGGVVEVPDALRATGQEDEPYANDGRSIHSILQGAALSGAAHIIAMAGQTMTSSKRAAFMSI